MGQENLVEFNVNLILTNKQYKISRSTSLLLDGIHSPKINELAIVHERVRRPSIDAGGTRLTISSEPSAFKHQ